jgi:hypothetical protein
MSTLIWILIIGGVFFLFMRGGCCGGHSRSHGGGHSRCSSHGDEHEEESHAKAGHDHG